MKGLLWMSVAASVCAFGQQRLATPFVLPDEVAMRKADILSEGVRMAGEVYSLKSMTGKKLPAAQKASRQARDLHAHAHGHQGDFVMRRGHHHGHS